MELERMASQSPFASDTFEAEESLSLLSVSETALQRAEADAHAAKTLAAVEEQSAAEEAKEIQEIEDNMAFNALEFMKPLQDNIELAIDTVIPEIKTVKTPDSALSLSQVCSIIVNNLLQADNGHAPFFLLSDLCFFFPPQGSRSASPTPFKTCDFDSLSPDGFGSLSPESPPCALPPARIRMGFCDAPSQQDTKRSPAVDACLKESNNKGPVAPTPSEIMQTPIVLYPATGPVNVPENTRWATKFDAVADKHQSAERSQAQLQQSLDSMACNQASAAAATDLEELQRQGELAREERGERERQRGSTVMECAEWMMLRRHSCKKGSSEPNQASSWFSGLAQVSAASVITSFLGGALGDRAPRRDHDEDKTHAFSSLDTALQTMSAERELQQLSALQTKAACADEHAAGTWSNSGQDNEDAREVPNYAAEYLKSFTDFVYHLECCVYTGLPPPEVQPSNGHEINSRLTPEMLEFLKALDLCETLSFWDELDQHLTSKRFLQRILVWRDLLQSVSQAIEIFKLALGRCEQARVNKPGEPFPFSLHLFVLYLVKASSSSRAHRLIFMLSFLSAETDSRASPQNPS
jgi:hypothetical protein